MSAGLRNRKSSSIAWSKVTLNCHTGKLDGFPVVTVERPQKHRANGTKHDWSIVVLGDRYSWNKVFCNHDPRDLDSTKQAAEARVKWAIENFYRAIRGDK